MTAKDRLEEILVRLEKMMAQIDLGNVKHFDSDGRDRSEAYAQEVRAIIGMHRELLADMAG